MPSKTWFLSFSWPSLCSDFSDFNFLVIMLGSHYLIIIPRWVPIAHFLLHLRRQREGCLQETPSEVLGSLFSRSPLLTCPLLHQTLASDMVISLALVTGSSQEPRLNLVFPQTPCMCVFVCDLVPQWKSGYCWKSSKWIKRENYKAFGKKQDHLFHKV